MCFLPMCFVPDARTDSETSDFLAQCYVAWSTPVNTGNLVQKRTFAKPHTPPPRARMAAASQPATAGAPAPVPSTLVTWSDSAYESTISIDAATPLLPRPPGGGAGKAMSSNQVKLMATAKIERAGISFGIGRHGGSIVIEVRPHHDTISALRGVQFARRVAACSAWSAACRRSRRETRCRLGRIRIVRCGQIGRASGRESVQISVVV